MLWYGSSENLKKLKSLTNNHSSSHWLKKKKNSFFLKKKYIYSLSTIYLYTPSCWKYSIIQYKSKLTFNIFFYSSVYFFVFPLNLNFLFIRTFLNSSTISFFFFYKIAFFQTFFSYIKFFLCAFSRIFFKKLKFKGKGYYVYKNKRNTIAFRFGYSHIKRVFASYNYVRFLSKTSIIIYGLDKYKISKTAKMVKIVRPINIFTAKGMRFTRQILYRKTGKVSSYR